MKLRVALACLAFVAHISLGLSRATGVLGRSLQQQRRSLAQCEPMSFNPLQPTITRAPVTDLIWLDKDDLDIIATTKKVGIDAGGVWQSKDGGKTWAEKTAALNSSIAGSAETVDVIQVYSQRGNPQNVLLLGSGSYMWVSNDFGNSFSARRNPSKWRGSGIKSVKMHPYRDWLLVLVKRPDCRSLDHMQVECPHDLFLNRDPFNAAGQWLNITADAKGKIAAFVDFDWGANLCPDQNCTAFKVKDETIFATMYETPGAYDQPWDPDVNFVVSHNWFDDFETHVRCGNMFEILGKSVYLAFANSCPTDIHGKSKKGSAAYPQGITLYTSMDGGNEFHQACLPVALKQDGYELMETHDGKGAIVIVDFMIATGFGIDLPASSVYTAGPHHALFSLSLTDVYHADMGYSTDFARVEALPGVFIANQMLPRYDESSDYYQYDDLSDLTGEPLVETRITFNGGGKWQRIPAPTTFNNVKCNRCNNEPLCYLHLHGMSSWDTAAVSYPAVYSNPSAPGLIMGTGNVAPVGVGLDENDGMCTWLSTDGGVTWQDVGEGTFIYEFADWGGVIVMAKHPGINDMPADEIRFSLNNGKCWQSVPLTTALLVDNIRIEPDGQRPRVVVHGRACRQSLHPKCMYGANETRGGVLEGLMYTVDIQELMTGHIGYCASQYDYEQWFVPSDLSRAVPRCMLGGSTKIQRRKADSVCLNGANYQRPAPATACCNCTLEDTECDYGFIKDGDKCVAIPMERMPFCPAIDDGSYLVSHTGRRLVHGDMCMGLAGIIPDTDGKGAYPSGMTPKESSHRHGFFFKLFITLLVLGVVCGAFYGWWAFLATEGQRDMVRDLVASVVSTVVQAWGLLMDKIRGHRGGAAGGDDLGYFQPLGDAGGREAHEQGFFSLK